MSGNGATTGDIGDLKKDLTLIIGIVGGVVAGLVAIPIIIASVICLKVSRLKKQVDLIQMSLRSIEKDMSKTQVALDRFPKNIVQFPMTKPTSIVDDDDRSGTEPASPMFYRKPGYTPTPLASSLTSVTEIPSEHQQVHHPLHRSNAMMSTRAKEPGPPVPPKRAHSFNNHSFNY